MAMNVQSPYYAGGMNAGSGLMFSTDRLYGGAVGGDSKFDAGTTAGSGGYASFDTASLHGGYPGQLHQQQHHAGAYGPFDAQTPGAKTPTTYPPPFDPYAACAGAGQPSPYTVQPSRYLPDPATAGHDVIAQYGGRHFGTAAMMAAAAVATMGGQHVSVGPAGCPTLPIYPWMRSMGAGT